MSEIDFIAKYAPALASVIATLILIAYTKKTLFGGMISKEMHDEQMQREKDFIVATKEAANHLEEISRQLEQVAKSISERIGQNTERIKTLELIISDNIDALRELSFNCEKHRKGIPDTVNLQQPRKTA